MSSSENFRVPNHKLDHVEVDHLYHLGIDFFVESFNFNDFFQNVFFQRDFLLQYEMLY